MTLEINEEELDGPDIPTSATGLVVVPNNMSDTAVAYNYSSTAISFVKYAKAQAPIEFLTEPEVLIEQRSGDWFAPMILISQAAIEAHPLIVNILSGLFTNYVYDFFKGQSKPKLSIDLVIETKKGSRSKYIRLKTRCSSEDLDVLMRRVKQIANDE